MAFTFPHLYFEVKGTNYSLIDSLFDEIPGISTQHKDFMLIGIILLGYLRPEKVLNVTKLNFPQFKPDILRRFGLALVRGDGKMQHESIHPTIAHLGLGASLAASPPCLFHISLSLSFCRWPPGRNDVNRRRLSLL